MKVEAQITVGAPVGKVFQTFTDFPNLEKRVEGIKKIEFLAKDGRPEVGMKWRETRVMFGKEATEDMWITEINQNRNYVVAAQSHGTKYRSEYIFTNKGDSTDVTLTFEGKPVTWGASLGSIMSILFKGSIEKALQADMENLKKHIEETS